MQVKACPKCKVENKPENVTCSGCYASLDGVEVTESQGLAAAPAQPPTPESAPPAAPAPPQQQPPAAQGPPSEQASPYGPAPAGAYGPRPTPQPVRQGSNVGVIILLLLIIGGGAFAGWWFFIKAPTPEQVVQRLVNAAKAEDLEGVKSCFTKASLELVKNVPGGEDAFAKSVTGNAGLGNDVSVGKIGPAVYEGEDRALVEIEPEQKSTLPAGPDIDSKFEMVLLREDGRWKIDLKQTAQHMMRRSMDEFKNRPKSALPKGGG